MDRFPVIIAQGREDGPVFWLTTGIHGPEHTGLIVLHNLITPELVKSLRGTLIAIPVLNPAGLRTKQRGGYYGDEDPNRLFPKPGSEKKLILNDGVKPLSALEEAYEHLFEAIAATHPAALLDLHNAWYGSIPFVIRDPIFYSEKRGHGLSRRQAEALDVRVGALVEAIGITPVNEFAASTYVSRSLHRSVSGSILNKGGIPSVTVELGSLMHIDPGVVEAGLVGVRNALRWAGLLTGDYEPVTSIPLVSAGFTVRRDAGVYAPHSGIVHFLVRPGEPFTKGQPLARICDVFGRPVGNNGGLVKAGADGFVLGWAGGVIHYQSQMIMTLAVRDDGEMVVPYPD
jgi:predicted deacylase